MTAQISVSRHARQRFILRVSAIDPPIPSIIEMWRRGRAATDEDLSIYRTIRLEGNKYRISQHKGGVYVLMVMRRRWIVTLLE